MRKITMLLMAAVSFHSLSAQSVTTSIPYNKADQPALLIELPYDEATSQEFIMHNLRKTGYQPETKGSLFWKNSKINGFYTFKGVRIDDKQTVDLLFRVEQKSKIQAERSLVYLLVKKEDLGFVSSSTDATIHKAAKTFLDGFISQSAAFKLEKDLEDQEIAVRESQKKMDKLKEEEKALLKKLEQIQNEVKRNKDDLEFQQKALENDQQKLDALRTRKGA
jgi:hypothetical protein